MNAERRKQVAKVIESLREAHSILSDLEDAEGCAYDNLPESIQCSERGEAMSAAADTLHSAVSSVDDAITELESIE